MMHRTSDIPFSRFKDAAPQVSFLAVMIFFSMYSRLLAAPLLVFIQTDLGISPGQSTRLFLPLSIAYAGAMLVSGFLTEKAHHRRTIALSALVIGIGLILVALVQSLPGMYVAFTLIGAGSGLYPPSGVASVTSLVDDHIRGRAIALHEVGPNLGFVLAPLFVSIGTSLGDWRWVAAISGVVAVVTGVLFDRYARSGRFHGQRPQLANIGPLIRKPEFWAIFVFFSLAASSTIGVYSILPTFLIRVEGYPVGPVNTLLSVSRISGVIAVLVSGILVDRIGVARLIALVFLLTGALTVAIGVLPGTPMLVAVFLQPVIITAFFPAAISAMSDLGPPDVRNVAVSVIIPGVNIVSNGVFPSVMGVLTEYGAIRAGFVGLGALMVLSLTAIPLLKRPDSPGAYSP
jgi:NNP family nitrate/nitrite transporter-like MFS transporter